MGCNEFQIWLTKFLIYSFVGTLCLTGFAIFLNGFNAWGFSISQEVILRLINVTFLEAAGLLGIAIRSIFKEKPVQSLKK